MQTTPGNSSFSRGFSPVSQKKYVLTKIQQRKFHKFQPVFRKILYILRKVEKNIIFGLILEKLWHTIGNERRLFPENLV